MPEQYLKIKRSLKASGKSDKEAKRIAAATYNKTHPDNPVTGNYEKKIARKKK